MVLNLPALTVLNLSFCKLSGTLPDLSLSRLLESVNVADNKIVELEQADLRCLPALHYFNVENNELKAYVFVNPRMNRIGHFSFIIMYNRLPIEFGVCSHLKALLVSGNPLRSVGMDIRSDCHWFVFFILLNIITCVGYFSRCIGPPGPVCYNAKRNSCLACIFTVEDSTDFATTLPTACGCDSQTNC